MTICSRTIDYCFLIVFGIFCNLIIPKQGIEMQMFFQNGLWRFFKNGHLPVKLHSSACLSPSPRVTTYPYDPTGESQTAPNNQTKANKIALPLLTLIIHEGDSQTDQTSNSLDYNKLLLRMSS